MTVEQLAKELDNIISPQLSEPWDNDGRMVIPDASAEVTRVFCTLECTSNSIGLAKQKGCNVILTHHPLIFKPLGRVLSSDSVGGRVLECIKSGISVLSYHTRLDSMQGGVNDMLADSLGLKNTTSFVPYGRLGEVEEQSFKSFCKKVCDVLGVELRELDLVRSHDRVRRVAVVSGCGKDEIGAAVSAGADTFVTGEVMHNHMVDCKELGLNLVCGTHYATERFVCKKLAEIVSGIGLDSVAYGFEREAEYGI